MTLETPDRIRELQRKLYRKAKQEPNFRFYLLYDKVYRRDILSHAYRLVKANKGASGVDGLTFERIEEREKGAEGYLGQIAEELERKVYRPMPVRRVNIPKPDGRQRPLGIPTIKDRVVQMAVKIVIEPIFEADFEGNSYGFRPKRNAHQAMDDISLHLRMGKTQVIDADISKYFDTIPHNKLLTLVAKRIVDKNILRLIKLWLKAPVVEEGEDGKKRTEGNPKGTPQGGVISPLLANIYLHVLDRIWKVRKVEERFKARLIRYADDFVVLCQGQTERVLKGIKTVLRGLELSLNEEKTRIVDARKERFNFLGYRIEVVRNPKTGKTFPLIKPSKEALAEIKAEIKALTCRKTLCLPKEVVIKKLNETVRGWVGYFYYGNCSRDLSSLKGFLDERVRTYLRRKHAKKSRGYKEYPYQYLYGTLGLYKIPTTAPWTHTAKAVGRR
ncbi:MAG: group II intron reverse transcriptase/maturase [Deltaproteobacteria bacterium]|nr:group II intron reverse transcriptase/maturase [Deltaproteobacteria bacterium]